MNDAFSPNEVSRFLLKLNQIQPEKTQSLDDRGFSSVFAQVFHDCLRFNVTAGQWFYYNGKHWTIDNGGMYAANCARLLAELLIIYGNRKIEDEAMREKFSKSAFKYGSLRYRETLVRDARSLLSISQTDFDRNTHLLNLRNVTLNLDTFETHPHISADMLTKMANVSYSPSADPSPWESFISEVFEGNTEKIAYIQRICGYCLTADTSLEAMFMLYGPTTRNGKSTFTETIAHMLGDYSATAQPETLSMNKNRSSGAASPELARLVGIRLVNLPEPPKKMLLDVGLVKQLTGGDMLTARNLYQAPFEFRPSFKMMINTNSLPTVTDSTLFTSNRVRIITFDRHFTPEEQNPNLKKELIQEENMSAILNWALEGLKLFRFTGERPPASVLTATEKFHTSSDKIVRFFAECMEKSDANTSGSDTYDCYSDWCTCTGYAVDSKGSFFTALRERGLMKQTGTVNGKTERNVICGYSIISAS